MAAEPALPTTATFAASTAAAITAETCMLPAKVVKVRMQMGSSSLGGTIAAVTRAEGLRGLWLGLPAAIARQTIYGNLRIGAFNAFSPSLDSVPAKLALGMCAGAGAAVLSNPLELLMTRMQNEVEVPRSKRVYRHGTAAALLQVRRELGLLGMYTGSKAAAGRAAVVTATEQTSYAEAKRVLLGAFGMRDAVPAHMAASAVAGFVVAAVTSPIDVVKSFMFTQAASGSPLTVSGSFAALHRSRGLLGFYRGFLPYWFQMAPWAMIMFVSLEQYKKLARSYCLPSDDSPTTGHSYSSR